MEATLSILGLYNYTNGDVFDEMVLPVGIDRDVLVMSILAECAELEVLYPEPATMGTVIGLWSAAELPIWRKLYETTQFDYNPIWNKDGTVTETESRDHVSRDAGSENETFRSEGSSSRSQNDAATQTGQVSAFDATDFQNRDKTSTSADSTEHVVADNENRTDRSSNRETVDGDSRTYERRETGNIGVTTTQQMIKEEREVDQFNIYDYIVQSFKRRFCLLVY